MGLFYKFCGEKGDVSKPIQSDITDNRETNNKTIAKKIFKVIGGTPKVIRYHDDDDKSQIDIFIGIDRPQTGVSTYSTIGLSEYSIDLQAKNGRSIRVEFVGACENVADKFPNVIGTCAFNIINDKYSCKPGTVYPNVIKAYYENIEMKHIYFTAPFLWDTLDSIVLDDRIVTWLLAIPISDKEYSYRESYGDDALEKLFEENDIDIFNIKRKSVL